MFWDCKGWGWESGQIVRTFFLMLSLAVALPGIAASGTVELVSRAPARRAPDTTGQRGTNQVLDRPSISADGRVLVFNSPAANLVPGQVDRNDAPDLFLYDRDTGAVSLVSHAAGSAVTAGDRSSYHSALSADGRFVVFSSDARDLTPLGDSPPGSHVFLFERATGAVTLVSRRAGSAEGADASAVFPRISADGSVVAYLSAATDLLPAPVPAGFKVYVYDRRSGVTTLAAGPAFASGDDHAESYALSADGRFVAVNSRNDRSRERHLFLWDRVTGGTRLIGQRASFGDLSLSTDGQFLAFSSSATDLIPGVTDRNRLPDVFLHDRLTGAISLVSRSAGAANVTSPEGGFEPSISANGSAVVYSSGKGESTSPQAFVFDLLTGTTALVTRSSRSATHPASQGADFGSLSISATGRYVAFSSPASNLVPGQSEPLPQSSDVFVLDRVTGAMTLVSHGPGSPARTGNGSSGAPALSADGGWIAFVSSASNLVADLKDPGATEDVFLWGRGSAETRAVSLHPPGMASLSPQAGSEQPAVSDDGHYVSFVSLATLLAPGFRDANGASDVFLYDRTTRKNVLVSRAHGSRSSANGPSGNPRISRDGNWILYESRATDLVRGQRDGPDTPDVFLYDRIGQRTILVSRSSRSRSRTARGGSVPRGLSADGSIVAFESTTPELIPGQEDNLASNVFLWDRRTGAVTLVNHVPESPLRPGFTGASFSSMSPDGNFVAFTSTAWNLVPNDGGAPLSAYLWDRHTGKVEALYPVLGESSRNPIVSADGRYAAFAATASQDTDETNELAAHAVVLLDRATGTLREVASPSPGGWPLGLSEDGRHLLFQSGGEEPPGIADLYLFDRISGETRLVSDTAGLPPTSRRSLGAQLSADGRYVAFFSRSYNVILYDRTSGESTLVSRSRLAPGQGGNRHCIDFSMSPTGGFVAFTSLASDLVARDFNLNEDVFLFSPGDLP